MIDLLNKAQTRAWEVVLINPTDLAIKAWTPPMLQPFIFNCLPDIFMERCAGT